MLQTMRERARDGQKQIACLDLAAVQCQPGNGNVAAYVHTLHIPQQAAQGMNCRQRLCCHHAGSSTV